MRLTFKKIIIHGFLSYGHSEIELDNLGYCLVKGVNKCPTDNALSNGAGKSSWISALCWALTGLTVQGNRSNLKNIYLEENSCYVTVFFNADGKEFEVTRINAPKSDLKIVVNGEDKSGKGIEESKKILAEYLPDLTKELLNSTIILGQGLPDRFTNNTPSGRKEVLEKLSKSDFMIEDIKERLNTRITQVALELRAEEDKILAEQSKRPILESQLEQKKQLYVEKSKPQDYDNLIQKSQENQQILQKEVEKLTAEQEKEQTLAKDLRAKTKSLYEERQKAKDKVSKEHQEESQRFMESIATKNSEKFNLETEISKMEKITDICPTCGQKLPNVVKPDPTPKKLLLEGVVKELADLRAAQKEDNEAYQEVLVKIGEKFDLMIQSAEKEAVEQESKVQSLVVKVLKAQTDLKEQTQTEANLRKEKQSYEESLKELQREIDNLDSQVKKSKSAETEATKKRLNLRNHQEILNKMATYVKRDFRGFLLQNVIAFIDDKCKEYAQEVFGTRDLEFKLNNNNIDILYAQKELESLSGGEQQRVNIIIQLAIRDMMCRFLNFSSNIIVLDELFDQLDTLSTSKVVDLITSQLRDLSSIFIISHHSEELDIPADSFLTIEKSSSGISTVL